VEPLLQDATTARQELKPRLKSEDYYLSELAGTFCDPIIAYPGGWGDMIPDWLKQTIIMERLLMNMAAVSGKEPTGTDAEACAYLMTASLDFPFDHDWTQIYLYVAGRVCSKAGKEVPSDIKVESLNNEQMHDLNRLKAWIYRTRVHARQERDRAERRQRKEAAATEHEIEQPALFQF